MIILYKSLVKARFENFDAFAFAFAQKAFKEEREGARIVESADRGNARVYI